MEETSHQAEALAEKLMQHEGVRHVSTFVGQPPPATTWPMLPTDLRATTHSVCCGDDPRVLDSLTSMAIDIMRRNPKVMNARNEWGNKAMLVRAAYDPVKAGRLNLGKADLMTAVKSTNDGTPVGIYRDGDKQVPVLSTMRRTARPYHEGGTRRNP